MTGMSSDGKYCTYFLDGGKTMRTRVIEGSEIPVRLLTPLFGLVFSIWMFETHVSHGPAMSLAQLANEYQGFAALCGITLLLLAFGGVFSLWTTLCALGVSFMYMYAAPKGAVSLFAQAEGYVGLAAIAASISAGVYEGATRAIWESCIVRLMLLVTVLLETNRTPVYAMLSIQVSAVVFVVSFLCIITLFASHSAYEAGMREMREY